MVSFAYFLLLALRMRVLIVGTLSFAQAAALVVSTVSTLIATVWVFLVVKRLGGVREEV